jgi:hypothetical protein
MIQNERRNYYLSFRDMRRQVISRCRYESYCFFKEKNNKDFSLPIKGAEFVGERRFFGFIK